MRRATDLIATLTLALTAAALVRAFVFTVYTVPDRSLEPQLRRGRHAVVGRLATRPPRRGDIIAVDLGGTRYLGRVTLTPGDTLSTPGGRRYVLPDIARCPRCGSEHPRNYLVTIGRGRTLVHETHVTGRVIASLP